MTKCQIVWHKYDPEAIIPTKRDEDAGFDIYTLEEDVTLESHQTKLFRTGLNVAIDSDWWLMVKDRGSTGSKGIHVHCGVIDHGFRGEVFICLNNTNPYPVKFTNAEEPGLHKHMTTAQYTTAEGVKCMQNVEVIDYLVYPTTKAIAQIIPVLQPIAISYEVDDNKWNSMYAEDSERGEGQLGASGK